jgi:hypothetical protein
LPGAPGAPGVSAFTILTANLAIPSTVGQNVTVSVGSTEWMVVGQPIFIAGPANFTLISISSTTSAVMRFESAPGDVAFGSTILAGAGVTTGANEISAFTITGLDFVIPAVGSNVTVKFAQTQFMGIGQHLMIGSNNDIFTVAVITDRNTADITYGNFPGNVNTGNTITKSSFAVIIGGDGLPAYSTTTSPTTIPAIGANVTAAVVNSDFMAVGQIVILSETATPAVGNFQVVSFPNSQSAVLKFLGYTGDSAPGVVIATGARASIAGILQSTSIGTLAVYGAGTAYAITATPQLITMGTTSPSLTITGAGTYLLFGKAVFNVIGTDGGPIATYTMQINRSNNTPALVANSADSFKQTSGQGGAPPGQTDIPFTTPPVVYTTANTNDVLQLWASVSAVPVGGATPPHITSCSLVALKLA